MKVELLLGLPELGLGERKALGRVIIPPTCPAWRPAACPLRCLGNSCTGGSQQSCKDAATLTFNWGLWSDSWSLSQAECKVSSRLLLFLAVR